MQRVSAGHAEEETEGKVLTDVIRVADLRDFARLDLRWEKVQRYARGDESSAAAEEKGERAG